MVAHNSVHCVDGLKSNHLFETTRRERHRVEEEPDRMIERLHVLCEEHVSVIAQQHAHSRAQNDRLAGGRVRAERLFRV